MGGGMRLVAAGCLVLLSFATEAAPLDEYYAARDAYIAKFENADVDDAALKQHENARDDLARKLRPIVGTLDVQGLPKTGEINLDSLYKGDQGFGTLDGLVFASEKNNTSVLVSTAAILERWLKEHADWWGPKLANVPPETAAAIREEAFYTQAVKTDAAFFQFAEIPVAKPANASAVYAMLSGRAQDNGLDKPDELIVTEIVSGKIYIVSVPPVGEIVTFPACDKIWQESLRKASELEEQSRASAGKEEQDSDASEKTRDDGYAAYRACFAEHAKGEKYFPALIKQAQEWVDQLSRQ
jgi:hypothetical protein